MKYYHKIFHNTELRPSKKDGLFLYKNGAMTAKISPTLALNQLSRKLEKEGKTVFKFGFGQSPFPVPAVFSEGIKRYADEKDYLPSQGLPDLKETIADYYEQNHHFSTTPEQILIGPGSKMLLFLIRLCVKGFTLLPSPSWVSYAPQADIIKRKVHWLETSFENNWLIDPDELDSFCMKNPSQHLLILNYPCNPTGSVGSVSYFKDIAKVCRRHNVLVISDEIYKDLSFDDDYISISKFYPEGTIICDGISKWAGAGGHRLGYSIYPPEQSDILSKSIAIASETYSCVSNPIQRAAVHLFKNDDSLLVYRKNCRNVLATIADYTYEELNKLKIQSCRSKGGFYLFPSFKFYQKALLAKGIDTSEKLCHSILKESGVALLAGVHFGRKETLLEARLSYVDFDGANALENADRIYSIHDDKWVKEFAPQIEYGVKNLGKWLSNYQ